MCEIIIEVSSINYPVAAYYSIMALKSTSVNVPLSLTPKSAIDSKTSSGVIVSQTAEVPMTISLSPDRMSWILIEGSELTPI